jgi:hypothetical protein
VPYLVAFLVASLLALQPLAAEPGQWVREGWKATDFSKSRIKWDEIQSGGPPKDGIPAIDKPAFATVAEISDLTPKDPVIGLDIEGDARAYPLRILIWHEIVNDTVGGRPVTVTYCPLCNSALVFDRRVGDRILDFGTTGKLRNSDLVMYDRQTESWWQQFTGEAIVGALSGSELKLVPARLESFADFKARHPEGRVLVPEAGSRRPYGSNPYVEYDTQAGPFLFRGDLPKDIEAMARVVVVHRAGKPPLVVALDHIRKWGAVVIESVHLAWRPGQVSAVDAAEIAESRDVGTVEARLDDGGKPGPLVAYDVTFAFVAHAFHPEATIIKE